VITQQRLRDVLGYDPETGVFTWLRTKGSRAVAGSKAGRRARLGYIEIMVDRRRYQAHRLAWLYMTGRHPEHLIDHINMDPGDNRFANLREATHSQNKANALRHRDNSTGRKGVYRTAGGRYHAMIGVTGKIHCLGTFATVEEAGEAYMTAAREHFGEFARAA
jgi:hypothetical protein